MLLSVPSTRVYAMKLKRGVAYTARALAFSTLDSGLRDETGVPRRDCHGVQGFQYPRLGSTR